MSKGNRSKRTNEWKQNLSELFNGKKNPFYGKHHTKETLDKIKLTKERLGINCKGENNPRYGCHLSKTQIEKQRNTLKQKFVNGYKTNFIEGNTYWDNLNAIKSRFKQGQVSYNKGKLLLDKTKEKISETRKKRIKEGKIKICIGKKFPKEVYPNMGFRTSRKNIIIPVKNTTIELKIQSFLKQLNIDFLTHQYIKDIEHGYQCDILIPSMHMVIECDGDYWHKYPIGNDIDHIRTSELLEKGFKVLRLWEFEIREMDINKFKERLNF